MRTAVLSLLLLLSLSALADKKTFTLVVDAGHGGHDPGAIGKTAKEKNINLATALAFGRMVEANCPDVKVVYTRKTDKFVTLQGRAQIANNNKADLFVSIHTNALPKGKVTRGAETYTLGMARADDNLEVAKRENAVILIENDYKTRYQGFDPNSSESYIIFEMLQDNNMAKSVQLAKGIQKQFGAVGRTDKGVHQAGFLVLRETTMPSVLVELGYITTKDEEQFLASADGANRMGTAIYNAFLSYYRQQPIAETSVKDTPIVETPAKEMPVEETPVKEPPVLEAPVAEQSVCETEAPIRFSSAEFRVQFMASSTKLNERDYPKNLDDVSFYTEGNTYKYTAGRFKTFAEAQRYRNEVAKRYNGAFVIAMLDGVRIDINVARKKSK